MTFFPHDVLNAPNATLMILGLGTDLVEPARLAAKLARSPALRAKLFAPAEIAYCERMAEPAQHYAGRFAAKEALLKALGLGLAASFDLHEAAVAHDEHGAPRFELAGELARLVLARGVTRLHLEEAPAPGMTQAMRQQMGEAAVAAARAVNYVGAGTVEFIVEQKPDGAMNFFFMEMNTRLQVEHPVTEAITGLDLVEWQLRVACGEKLPLAQEQLKITGHAIEARICAETPDKNFLPATGTLHVYGLPDCVTFEGGAVRVDSGVRAGDTISPYYDSMVAKLIVHGATRDDALARLDLALSQTHIVGLSTNVQFLRHVVQSPSFVQANLDTALIPREAALLFNQEKVGLARGLLQTLSSGRRRGAFPARADASRRNIRARFAARSGWCRTGRDAASRHRRGQSAAPASVRPRPIAPRRHRPWRRARQVSPSPTNAVPCRLARQNRGARRRPRAVDLPACRL